STRVVALDPAAADVVRPLIGRAWRGIRFLIYAKGDGDGHAEVVIDTGDGTLVRLDEAGGRADFLVMVATDVDGVPAVSAIGDACALHGVMTAGVVLGECSAAVSALRPYARVLLVTTDTEDLSEVLWAVGA